MESVISKFTCSKNTLSVTDSSESQSDSDLVTNKRCEKVLMASFHNFQRTVGILDTNFEVVYSSRGESAVGRLSVASIYGIGCQQCHCQWKYILRPRKRCPHFRQHFCLFVSYLACSITSREMSITFCFKSTFCRQIVSCFKYFLIK